MPRTRAPALEIETVGGHNLVVLRGRLTGVDEPRVLPSGDELVSFRVVVPRRPDARAPRRASVDAIDCQAVRATVRRSLLRLTAGDPVELEGSLRRRFWHGAGGVASRYAVEVEVIRRAKDAT